MRRRRNKCHLQQNSNQRKIETNTMRASPGSATTLRCPKERQHQSKRHLRQQKADAGWPLTQYGRTPAGVELLSLLGRRLTKRKGSVRTRGLPSSRAMRKLAWKQQERFEI